MDEIISPIQDLSKETLESIQTRVQNCTKELEALLMKYKCTLQVQNGVAIIPMNISSK